VDVGEMALDLLGEAGGVEPSCCWSSEAVVVVVGSGTDLALFLPSRWDRVAASSKALPRTWRMTMSSWSSVSSSFLRAAGNCMGAQ
jgi:hypothetical protein